MHSLKDPHRKTPVARNDTILQFNAGFMRARENKDSTTAISQLHTHTKL